MLFLLLLVVAYAVLRVVRPGHPSRARWRIALGLAMAIAGAMHLLNPEPFVQHLPPQVPGRLLVVWVSGVIEIGLGLALVVPSRWTSAVGTALAVYLVLVFPANVYVAAAGIDVEGQPGGVYPWVRLVFQPLFVWLAAWSSRPVGGGRVATDVPGREVAP